MVQVSFQALLAVLRGESAERNPHAHSGMGTHGLPGYVDLHAIGLDRQPNALADRQRRERVDVTSTERNIRQRTPEPSAPLTEANEHSGIAGVAREPAPFGEFRHRQYSLDG